MTIKLYLQQNIDQISNVLTCKAKTVKESFVFSFGIIRQNR